MHVPGMHRSDVSYDDLLGYLAEQGRDFTADNRTLRAHVKQALLLRFEGFQRAPNLTELREVAAAAIVEWVVMRFDRKVRDVDIKPNNQTYLRWKSREGYGTTPGVKTGELRDAIERRARVKVTT